MNYEQKTIPNNARLICTVLVDAADRDCWSMNIKAFRSHYVWRRDIMPDLGNGVKLSDRDDRTVARIFCIEDVIK